MQEIHLKELIGTAAFTQNGNYIVGTTDRQNANFRRGVKKSLILM